MIGNRADHQHVLVPFKPSTLCRGQRSGASAAACDTAASVACHPSRDHAAVEQPQALEPTAVQAPPPPAPPLTMALRR